jgi:hypothetical protein
MLSMLSRILLTYPILLILLFMLTAPQLKMFFLQYILFLRFIK